MSPLLIFNSSWPADECSSDPDYDRYNTFCGGIVSSHIVQAVLENNFKLLIVWKVLWHPVTEGPQHQEGEQREGQNYWWRHLWIYQERNQGSICWRKEKQEVPRGPSNWNVLKCLWRWWVDQCRLKITYVLLSRKIVIMLLQNLTTRRRFAAKLVTMFHVRKLEWSKYYFGYLLPSTRWRPCKSELVFKTTFNLQLNHLIIQYYSPFKLVTF